MNRAYVARQVDLAKRYLVGGNETAARDAVSRALSAAHPALFPTPEHAFNGDFDTRTALAFLHVLRLGHPSYPMSTEYPPPNG